MQTLTDEQHTFVEAIRDFARRECGAREQRDARVATTTYGGTSEIQRGIIARTLAR